MKTILSIIFCLIATSGAMGYVISDTVPIDPSINYGVWFDRDGVDPYQASYHANTGGIYDIDILYHAHDTNTAVMWVTINDIPQGYDADGDQVVDTIYGLSFTSNYLNAMQVFASQWYAADYTGAAAITDMTVSQNAVGTISYSDLSFDCDDGNGASYAIGNTSWDLTAGDLIFSYNIDLSSITGNPAMIVYQLGLTPDTDLEGRVIDWSLLNPAQSRWLGNVVLYPNVPNPDTLNLNDKFDLQNAGGTGEGSYDVIGEIPEPVTIGLFGLGGLALLRRKR